MKKTILIVALLLLPSPSWAQAPLLADLQAERSHYGASMSGAEVAAMLNAVAWRHRAEGWGLLRKGSGNSCPLTGTFISCDILIHAPTIQHFDVLIDAEGRAEPTWNLVGPCILGPSSGCEMSRFLSPVDPGGGPIVTPVPPIVTPPVPPVQTDNSAQIERVFADLSNQIAALNAQHVALAAQLKQHDEDPHWLQQVFGNRYVQLALAGVGTWLGTAAAK